jgi:hypothetical protein
MNKHLLATFLTLSTIPFFSISGVYPKPKQQNKTQLLNHLKNVKVTLQKYIKTMHDNWEAASSTYYPAELEEAVIQEDAEMTLLFNLTEDFYKNSISMQQKLSELITPAFNFICNNIKPLDIDEISRHIKPYTASRFDKDTTKQLQALFQPLYTKHYKICRNSHPNIKFTQVPVDELFEQCFQFIIFPNELFIYGSRVLLQKLNDKIKELS